MKRARTIEKNCNIISSSQRKMQFLTSDLSYTFYFLLGVDLNYCTLSFSNSWYQIPELKIEKKTFLIDLNVHRIQYIPMFASHFNPYCAYIITNPRITASNYFQERCHYQSWYVRSIVLLSCH